MMSKFLLQRYRMIIITTTTEFLTKTRVLLDTRYILYRKYKI